MSVAVVFIFLGGFSLGGFIFLLVGMELGALQMKQGLKKAIEMEEQERRGPGASHE